MKVLAWIGGVLAAILGLVYVVAFTPLGNGIVAPIIEKKIAQQTNLPSKLSTFSLSMSSFEILLELSANNTVHIKGNYSLFSQAFDVAYRVKLEELSSLSTLAKMPLNGNFRTEGSVKGDMEFIEVDGKSDVAKSETAYRVELTELQPTSIIATVSHAKLAELLNMAAQKAYASADIDLNVNFKNITPHQLDGSVKLLSKNALLNTKVLKDDFNITIPHTTFTMSLDALLRGDDVTYEYGLLSNLATLTSAGKVTPEPLMLDVKYALDIAELALLKPISGADVRGSFKLSGTAKGGKESLLLKGKSDVAASNTTFEVALKEFKPANIKANIQNLDISRVLYMVKQPHYTEGKFNMACEITDADPKNPKGHVKTEITNGLLDSHYLTKTYEFKSPMPQTFYAIKTFTKLGEGKADTKVDMNSNLLNLAIKSAIFTLADGSIKSDYRVEIPSLDRLYFVTERHMRGGITANGEFKKDKNLEFTAHSNIAGGKLDAKLFNDDFSATLKGVQTLGLLNMLIYPEIFKSSLDGEVKYNLAAQKGDFKGMLIDGKFTKNQLLDLTKKYAQIDLYVETFKGNVSANINKEKIVAFLDLRSNKSSIVTKETKLNSKTKEIDSRITITANEYPLTVTIEGKTDEPKVGLDAKELIKSKTGDAIKKEASKLFKGLF